MPYANAYNTSIARALHGVAQKHVNVENAINDNPVPIDVTSQLEGMTWKNADIVGGSGFATSTVQDLGFEPTLGATGEAKPKNAGRKMNVAIADALAGSGVHDRRVGEGVAGAGVAGAGVAGAGVAGAGKRKRGKKTGGLLTLTALDSMEESGTQCKCQANSPSKTACVRAGVTHSISADRTCPLFCS